jgi:hypothetical protein
VLPHAVTVVFVFGLVELPSSIADLVYWHAQGVMAATPCLRLACDTLYGTKRSCVSCFPDKSGYLVGSIEGRVAVQHVDDSQVGLGLKKLFCILLWKSLLCGKPISRLQEANACQRIV